MTFPERLAELIGPSRGSASRLSEAVGVSRSVVNEWLHDRKRPSMENIISLAQYFSVTTDYLLCVTNANKAPAPGLTENGRVMLELFNQLPERDQLLLLGRLQEMVSPISGGEKGAKTSPPSSAERVG